MTDEAEVTVGVSPQMERVAVQRAKDRAGTAKWDLNIAIFLFAILIMVIILATYTKAGIEIVAPVAVFGLIMVWLEGWRRGRQLYHRFYDEELLKIEQEVKKTVKAVVKETVEETIEERVQKALRERWR
jgi:uncharacterized integral membrane protein